MNVVTLIYGWKAHRIQGAITPNVSWATNPIAPNETVILTTPAPLSFTSISSVSVCDGDGTKCEDVKLQQTASSSTKFIIPANRKTNVWSILAGPQKWEIARLNEADPWWATCVDDVIGTAPTTCMCNENLIAIFIFLVYYSLHSCRVSCNCKTNNEQKLLPKFDMVHSRLKH